MQIKTRGARMVAFAAVATTILTTGTPAQTTHPSPARDRSSGVAPPLAETLSACNNFGLGPYHYSQFNGTRSGRPHAIPIDVTISSCLDGSAVYTDSLHVSARFLGTAGNLQKTVDDLTRVSCPAKALTRKSQSKEVNELNFGYVLSNVSIQSDPTIHDHRQHANLSADISATPCEIIPVKFSVINVSLDLTHTVFHIHISLPIAVDTKTLSLSFGDPVVDFLNTEHTGGPSSRTERLWADLGADKSTTIEKMITERVREQVVKVLSPSNPDLQPFFHPGDAIPKNALTSVVLKNAMFGTANGAVSFDISVTGEVPRLLLESYVRGQIERSGLQ